MKLANLVEGRGEEVMAFSDALENFDGSSTSKETVDQMRAVGSMLFKSGFKFKMDEPSDLEFSLTTDNGCLITASIVHLLKHEWALHLVGQEKDVMLTWDSTPLDRAVKLQGSQIIKVIDDVFKSLDEADLTLGVKHKFVRK